MAISVEASASAALTASRSPSVTFSSYTPLTNDIVIMFPSATGTGATPTGSGGWFNMFGGTTDVESDSHELCCFGRVVTAANEAAVDLTYTATNLYAVNQTGNVCAVALRGVDLVAIPDTGATTFSSTDAATPHVLAALSAGSLSNRSLVISCVVGAGTLTHSAPAGWTILTTSNTNMGKTLLRRDALTNAGVAVAATNITPSVGDEYCSATLALNERRVPVVRKPLSVPVQRAGFY